MINHDNVSLIAWSSSF